MAFKGVVSVYRKMTARVLKIVSSWYIGGTQVTSTAAELNKLDGVTATTAEINILAGISATKAELDKLSGVTATTDEINVLAGLTASTAELNKMDGVTLTATQINKANRQAVATRIDAVTPGDMTTKVSILTVANAATLQKGYFVPDAAFSTAADAFAYELINVGTDGGGTASIATLDLSGAVANLTAYKPADFGALTNASVVADGAVALQVTKKGSGTDSKAGVLILEFTI